MASESSEISPTSLLTQLLRVYAPSHVHPDSQVSYGDEIGT